jgi:hypothetical protein
MILRIVILSFLFLVVLYAVSFLLPDVTSHLRYYSLLMLFSLLLSSLFV